MIWWVSWNLVYDEQICYPMVMYFNSTMAQQHTTSYLFKCVYFSTSNGTALFQSTERCTLWFSHRSCHRFHKASFSTKSSKIAPKNTNGGYISFLLLCKKLPQTQQVVLSAKKHKFIIPWFLQVRSLDSRQQSSLFRVFQVEIKVQARVVVSFGAQDSLP